MTNKELRDAGYKPACLDAGDANLENGIYCWFCGMPWYNCLCCHDDDDYEDNDYRS